MRLVSGGRMTCADIAVHASTAVAAVTNTRFEIALSQYTTIPICRENLVRLLFAFRRFALWCGDRNGITRFVHLTSRYVARLSLVRRFHRRRSGASRQSAL